MIIRILSALALGAMTSLALAQPATQTDVQSAPVKLTATQMDRITAGANPHEQSITTNPGGVQNSSCPSNPNCETFTFKTTGKP
jgi:hypothetical protein